MSRGSHANLASLCEPRIAKVYKVERRAVAGSRLAHELAIIEEREWAEDFLSAAEAVSKVRELGRVVGPGWHALASSIVCYLLGITAIDPLEHDLVAERFLSPTAECIDADIAIASRQARNIAEALGGTLGSRVNNRHVLTAGRMPIDLLGMEVLDRIELTLETIGAPAPAPWALPLDDESVYDLLCAAPDAGLFAFESIGIRRLLHELQPRRFEDLCAAIALWRPGPAHLMEEYVRRAHLGWASDEVDEALADFAGVTHGMFIYQEQIMDAAMRVGGLGGEQAHELRRAVGRHDREKMTRLRDAFATGVEKTGRSPETAQALWERMTACGGYAFCRAHAVAAAVFAYWDAYLEAHHLEERAHARRVIAESARPLFPLEPRADVDTEVDISGGREELKLSLRAGEVALIFGPPYSGKTRLACDIARHAVEQGARVACYSFSPYVCDFERRVGHESRVTFLKGHRLQDLEESGAFAGRWEVTDGKRSVERTPRRLLVLDRVDLEARLFNSPDEVTASAVGRDLLAESQIGQYALVAVVDVEADQARSVGVETLGTLAPLAQYADCVIEVTEDETGAWKVRS